MTKTLQEAFYQDLRTVISNKIVSYAEPKKGTLALFDKRAFIKDANKKWTKEARPIGQKIGVFMDELWKSDPESECLKKAKEKYDLLVDKVSVDRNVMGLLVSVSALLDRVAEDYTAKKSFNVGALEKKIKLSLDPKIISRTKKFLEEEISKLKKEIKEYRRTLSELVLDTAKKLEEAKKGNNHLIKSTKLEKKKEIEELKSKLKAAKSTLKQKALGTTESKTWFSFKKEDWWPASLGLLLPIGLFFVGKYGRKYGRMIINSFHKPGN